MSFYDSEEGLADQRHVESLTAPVPDTDKPLDLHRIANLGIGAVRQNEALITPFAASVSDYEHLVTPIGEYIASQQVEEGPATSAIVERKEQADRSNEVFKLYRDPETFEVHVESDLTLEDWEKITPRKDWELMLSWANDLKVELAKRPEDKRSVVFINPTMAGGGVAMMRPPLIFLLNELGIDAHWFVMEPPHIDEGEPPVFEFTKQIHNTIQGRLPADIFISEEGKQWHKDWAAKNAKVLFAQPEVQNAAIGIIDDPQGGPLAEGWKAINPDLMLGWRNHIHNFADHLVDKATAMGVVHEYLQSELGLRHLADFCIYHPDVRNNFVPIDNWHKTFLAPATIESHDDMNRDLSPEERAEGIKDINDQIIANNELAIKEGRYDDIQGLLDIDRDRIVVIARFDESKGFDKAMKLGAQIRQQVIDRRAAEGITGKKPPQIVIIGNGSVDDPSGPKELEKTLRLRREKYGDIKEDIIVQRLVHNYIAINAVMYNDSEEAALIAMQTSDAEGCETRITDWVNHGIPIMVADIGGMPLQVINGESGLILDWSKPDHDLKNGTNWASDLIMDSDKYKAMRRSTFEASKKFNKREYSTTANVTRFLRAFTYVLNGWAPDKEYKISRLLDQSHEMLLPV